MITQICIFAFGMTAIYLVNDKRPNVRRWGCIFGLLAQPFWFYETFMQAQWGIFAASFVYAYSWWRGFKAQWL